MPTPFSLTPFLRPIRPSPLLSHAFPALSYTTRFLSYAPLLLLTWLSYSLAPFAQALLVLLCKSVEECRQGKVVSCSHSLHLTRCSVVPENVQAAAHVAGI